MSYKRLFQWLILFTLLLAAAITGQPAQAQEPVVAQVEFITHTGAGLAEQHVFVESSDGAGQVIRPRSAAATDPASLAQPLYTSGITVGSDFLELGLNPFGPFPAGEPLGFTLEEWLAATGSGTYTLNGDTADLDFTFQNLVPNGFYTMWCSRLRLAPTFEEDLHPCGADDGSQSGFVADAEGNGSFNLTIPAMPASTQAVVSDIALAYHSDGKSYGASPGDFGRATHVQLFAAAPPPASEEQQIEAKIEEAVSAAPMAIAAEATIMDYPANDADPPSVLREGSNGWTCWPDWPATPGLDPQCNDEMWTELVDAIVAGREPNITRPGLSYMLQGGSDPSNTDPFVLEPAPGEEWISTPPHVMLVFPGKLDLALFSTDHHHGGPYIMWAGTPYEHIMMPVQMQEMPGAGE